MIAIEDIYDAAFDRGRFPTLVEQLVRAFGAKAGWVAWYDSNRNEGFQAEFGSDPRWLQSYVETYAPHDILRPHLEAMPEGHCENAWPHLQTQEVRESLFYREYLAPQGVVDNLAVNLIKRPGINANLALLRVEPMAPFEPADSRRLSTLVPHLRRAVYIQSHLVRAADQASGAHALAGAGSMYLLLSADLTVAEIDPQLSKMLRLRPGDALAEGRLGKAIQRAIDRQEPVAIEVPVESGSGLPLLCEARPLEPNRFGDLSAGPGPTHAVHITLLSRPRSIAYEAMAALYRLTPTELKVLRDAIEHGDLAGIGERQGMAPATARTHLHRIYDKTGVRSFAGLANLAHRFGRLARE